VISNITSFDSPFCVQYRLITRASVLMKSSAEKGQMHSTTTKSIALTAIAAPMFVLLFLCTAFLVGARDTATQSWFLVAKTSDLPSDGTPLLKTVSAKRFDAWMRLPDKPICDVFVRKSQNADGASVVHSWHHDQFRIPIRYDQKSHQYVSVCWNIACDLQGREVIEKESPPTGLSLTPLPVRVADGAVWVRLDGVRQ
jgi:hypothetical protein